MSKTSKCPFSGEFKERIIESLDFLMRKEKIYRNADLSLLNLAHRLQTNTAYLSRIINDHYHVNFNTWVNRYRIAEVKSMLLVEDMAIEKIGELAGFGSKSVFNKAFKLHTGLTPSKWLKGQGPI